MLIEDVHPTFNWLSDTVPFDQFWGKREKFIHTEGVTVGIKWVPKGKPSVAYTGLFATGTDYGYLRFSTGPPSDPTKAAKGNFSPGMALKLLRDDYPSANLVAAPTG